MKGVYSRGSLLVSGGFSAFSSLLLPSFNVEPLHLVFGLIEANQAGALAGVTQALDHAIDCEHKHAFS
jgi:hypothetical protein